MLIVKFFINTHFYLINRCALHLRFNASHVWFHTFCHETSQVLILVKRMTFSKNTCGVVDKLFQKKITFDLFSFLALKIFFHFLIWAIFLQWQSIFAMAEVPKCTNIFYFICIFHLNSPPCLHRSGSQTLSVYSIFGHIVPSVEAVAVFVFITWPWKFNSYWIASLGIWPLQ